MEELLDIVENTKAMTTKITEDDIREFKSRLSGIEGTEEQEEMPNEEAERLILSHRITFIKLKTGKVPDLELMKRMSKMVAEQFGLGDNIAEKMLVIQQAVNEELQHGQENPEISSFHQIASSLFDEKPLFEFH